MDPCDIVPGQCRKEVIQQRHEKAGGVRAGEGAGGKDENQRGPGDDRKPIPGVPPSSASDGITHDRRRERATAARATASLQRR